MTKNKSEKKSQDKSSATKKVLRAQQMGARRTVIEEMFNDYYHDRRKIYLVNFIRGISFGLGSVLGATVVVTIIIWLLSIFVDFPGLIGSIAERVQTSLESR
jgi:hypothetical protein|tara:strand:- start:14449 stop:14754 length:306 start_codon:yes stop_codon:yes gene_type:complete